MCTLIIALCACTFTERGIDFQSASTQNSNNSLSFILAIMFFFTAMQRFITPEAI
uniref:Uncharacterized protein n=1 Tax=Anguilla anguilla TaxID=7936 RepID=A0A0E9TMT1_ANGAN